MNNSPPREIPEELLSAFTLQGKIPVKSFYFDKPKERETKEFTTGQIDHFIELAKQQKSHNYPETDPYIYEFLEEYPCSINYIKDKRVVVLGSCSCFYESLALAYGAKSVTTIEYNKRICKDKRIRTLMHYEYDNWCKETALTGEDCLFDVAFAISSFEHDGLGRYGDSLDPFGDIRAMLKTHSMLREDGILLLAVPIGIDCIFWNAHRMYGSIRLRLLIDDDYWKVLSWFGWKENKLDRNESYHYQPLVVLQII